MKETVTSVLDLLALLLLATGLGMVAYGICEALDAPRAIGPGVAVFVASAVVQFGSWLASE